MTDYSQFPVDAPLGVDPVIFRSQILQSMALQYFEAMGSNDAKFSMAEAFEAAAATWETEWDDDPAPRTLESARDAVSADLEYWNEE